MRIVRKILIAAVVSGLVPALGAAAQAERIGQLRSVAGEAFVVRGDAREPAVVGKIVQQKDVIETGKDGAVGITFDDNSVFSTGPNSNVSLDEFKYNPSTLKGSFLAKLGKGTLSVISGDIARGSPEAMKIRTPSAILGVRGTRFLVRVDEQ
jgi:hypothetical protein